MILLKMRAFFLIGIFLVAFTVNLVIKESYWVYIPAIIDYIKYPILPNQPVVWRQGKKTRLSSHGEGKKPNVIVILVDDLGFNDITFFGGGFQNGAIRTPNIDSIGLSGVSFDTAYAGHATCAPSRAALLTGRFPTKIGYEYTPISDVGAWVLGSYMNFDTLKGVYHADRAKGVTYDNMSMTMSAITIAEAMVGSGYKTIQIGKWHNGATNGSQARSRGFDETLGFPLISRYLPRMDPRAVNCVLNDVLDKFLWANSPYLVSKDDGPYFEPEGYLTDYLADEAVNSIRANKDDPFFMFLAFTAIHTPLSALKSDFDAMSNITNHCDRVYAAMLLSLDRAVGKVLQSLDELNIADNTIVIFSSDNGGPGYVDQRHINDPYRGWKASFFEGGIRVPLFVKWPGEIAAGIKLKPIVSHIDIFPTVLSAMQISFDHDIDGVDLLPLLRSKFDASKTTDDVHELLFWRSGHYKAARVGDWKIQTSENPRKHWLYDLKSDPTEKMNLALDRRYEQKLKELLTILESENKKQVESQWPSLSESPVAIDKIYGDKFEEGDEFIYWPN